MKQKLAASPLSITLTAKVFLRLEFKDYDMPHEGIRVFVTLPLNKDASIADIESQATEDAKLQLKKLVSGF